MGMGCPFKFIQPSAGVSWMPLFWCNRTNLNSFSFQFHANRNTAHHSSSISVFHQCSRLFAMGTCARAVVRRPKTTVKKKKTKNIRQTDMHQQSWMFVVQLQALEHLSTSLVWNLKCSLFVSPSTSASSIQSLSMEVLFHGIVLVLRAPQLETIQTDSGSASVRAISNLNFYTFFSRLHSLYRIHFMNILQSLQSAGAIAQSNHCIITLRSTDTVAIFFIIFHRPYMAHTLPAGGECILASNGLETQ